MDHAEIARRIWDYKWYHVIDLGNGLRYWEGTQSLHSTGAPSMEPPAGIRDRLRPRPGTRRAAHNRTRSRTVSARASAGAAAAQPRSPRPPSRAKGPYASPSDPSCPAAGMPSGEQYAAASVPGASSSRARFHSTTSRAPRAGSSAA